ncbi:possible major core protein [Mal de Rio Cuarto virus]|uniref:Possible major core protein n=1 Tax=Mal de Rio Cuarto virus TaxID=185954 RepID=Q809E8_9REOV|nr:possible major core protein [Mal de Rio Cuarto virus]AAO73185.1 possible major core protein [Mal de Rio Cuarto virus]
MNSEDNRKKEAKKDEEEDKDQTDKTRNENKKDNFEKDESKNESTPKVDPKLVENQEGITNSQRPEDITYKDGSTIQAKTALTVEAIMNIQGHLKQSDQKLVDEQATQYLSYLTSNVPTYTTTFGITDCSDFTLVPFYRTMDYTDDSAQQFPSLFCFNTYVNQYYDTDMTTFESKRYFEIFQDHPALLRSSEAFPVNAYKVSVGWNGNSFAPEISDPTVIGDVSLIKNVSYVGVHSSDNYKDKKMFSRLKTFLEIAANCNLVMRGCRTKPLSIEYENTAISKKLAGKKILYNDRAHIIFNGIYHAVTPFMNKINDMLMDGNTEINFDQIYKFGRTIITKINTYDMVCKGYSNIDQFTAYLVNQATQRVIDNRMTANKYKTLMAANYPNRVSMHVFDTMIDDLLFVYCPTEDDWKFSMFVIMIDKNVRSLMMNKALSLMSTRNLFGQNDIGVRLTTLINNKNNSPTSREAVTYFMSVLAGGNIESFCQLLTAEMYARSLILKLKNTYVETEYLDILVLLEVLFAFIITPRLAWWNSHRFGRTLFNLMYTFCNDEWNKWEAEFGVFVKHQNASWVKVNISVDQYDLNDLLDGIVFSFLVNRNYDQSQLSNYPFISSIYNLIAPLGEYVNLTRKTAAKYPFFETTVRGYLPCSADDYRQASMINAVNTRVNAIGARVHLVTKNYFSHNTVKTSVKESYNTLLTTIRIASNNLGLLMHYTVAPMLKTMYESFLFVCDGFDRNNPWRRPRMISYSGYNVWQRTNNANEDLINLLKGKGITIPLTPLHCFSKIYTYIALGVHGVCRNDTVTTTGSFLSRDFYDPNTINILPFNGQEITDLALKIVGHSKRINTVFTIFNYLHKESKENILETVRERLSTFWTTSNGRAVLNEITRTFNCPVERYFEHENAFYTMDSDPRVYHPTLYASDANGNIDQNQPASCAVHQKYKYGDDNLVNMLKVISHVTFDDELPLFRQVEGLAFGYYSTSATEPSDYFNVDNDTEYYTIDLDATPGVFTTTGTDGFSVQLKFEKDNVNHEYINPLSEKIPKIKFVLKRLGNMNEHFVIFMKRMIDTKRHMVVLKNVIVDYNIITLSNWKDFKITEENLFSKFVENRDLNNIQLDFYDTRFIIQNRTDELLDRYIYLSYRNITPLKDFVVMGGIFRIPNQAIDKLTAIDKDVYCFGEESGQTSKYFVSKKEKIKGSTVNFNNHFTYLGPKTEVRLPVLDIRVSSLI